MTTTMSSSNLSVFKKTQFAFLYGFALRKTAGWTAIYSILLFLCYPLVTITEAMELAERTDREFFNPINYIMNTQVVCSFLVSALLCGMTLVFSAVLYSYMHGKRSADFFHSMPVERGVMLTANFAAGLTAIVVPVLVNTAIANLAYPLILPNIEWGFATLQLWMQILAWALGAFSLLAVGTLVAVCVSTAVENVGYTVALLLEGSLVLLVWDMACGECFDTYVSIFSSSGTINNFFADLLYYLSPVFALARVLLLLVGSNLLADVSDLETAMKLLTAENAWLPLLLWSVLGAGALVLAVKLYEKRQSERAQQWGRQSWLGFTVKLASAIIGAWLFAVIFGEILEMPQNLRYSFGALTGAPLVYIIIEAITNKGFTNMKKCLPYMGAAVGIVLVGSFYFAMDGFGFDENIPAPEQVKTVELELMNVYIESKYGDKYAKEWSAEKENLQNVRNVHLDEYRVEETLTLQEKESVELVTKLHREAIDHSGDYMMYGVVSYDDGLLDTNRSLNIYSNGVGTLLEILHSDEYLENYNPFFELKGSHLEFVQISDKLGNLINDGEIPAEAFDRLLEAIRADLKNTDAEKLRDVVNNPEVAQLNFVTKYPQEIYESTGDLYHYDMQQSYLVRQSDAETCRVLEELGFELKVQDHYYENLMSVEILEAYRYGGDIPGMSRDGVYGTTTEIIDKYDYYVGDTEFTNMEDMKPLLEQSTSIYSGYGDQYLLHIFSKDNNGRNVLINDRVVDRAVLAERMHETGKYMVPYILSEQEWDVLYQDVMDRDGQYSVAEEYLYWMDVESTVDSISMLDYCKEHHPEILDGKTEAELKCMEKTPLVNKEYGSFYRVHW